MSNLRFSYQNSLVPESEIKSIAHKLRPYLKKLQPQIHRKIYNFPESSLLLPADEGLLVEVKKLAKQKINARLAAVVVIGIGGANLGSRAVYDALKYHQHQRKMLFAETIDPANIGELLTRLERIYHKGNHVEIVLISTSGKTVETLANYAVLTSKLCQLDSSWKARVTVITYPNSPLAKYAKMRGLSLLTVPKIIGDRYAVFSPAGLFPLGLAGINIENLRTGAQQVLEDIFYKPQTANHTLFGAAISYYHYQQNRTLHNTFFFAPQLGRVGQWYRQLLAESLGKMGKGFTPITSIGTTDLHSQLQLFLDGPDDKVTTFVCVEDFGVDQTITNGHKLEELVADIEGKTMTELIHAIYQGMITAYQSRERPFVEIELKEINEYELGRFFQMKMLETMFLGELFGINPFDQPAVETYKAATRQILAAN